MNTSRLSRLLQSQWLDGGWLSTLLLPLSWLTGLGVAMRRLLYRSGLLRPWRAPVPVVVVGNILVGGTGKTPVVLATVAALRARGWQPGVVSRGYGARVGARARLAEGHADPAQVGDEPALIAAAGIPVAVHPRRPLAVRALLAAHPATDVVVADDGLQHLALARDIEIVVQDARGIGNGRLLPAGPLREPAGRLARADAVVTRLDAGRTAAKPARAGTRELTMRLRPAAYERLADGWRCTPAQFRQASAGQVLCAAAGIGRPEGFFATLRADGLELAATLALPDHYDYRDNPFVGLPGGVVLVTAKDAVKCAHLGEPRLWAVHAEPEFSDPGFFDWLHDELRQARSRPSRAPAP